MVKRVSKKSIFYDRFDEFFPMPRSPRIELEDAVYHAMARGNRREPIVFDDHSREMFVETFAEAVEMTN